MLKLSCYMHYGFSQQYHKGENGKSLPALVVVKIENNKTIPTNLI